MVFNVVLKNISFKQDLSSAELMLLDQKATYAVLRYAEEIPTAITRSAFLLLSTHIEDINYFKLKDLVVRFNKATPSIVVDFDEIEETLDIPVNNAISWS